MKRPLIIGLLVAALLLVLAGIGAVVFFTARGGDFGFNQDTISATAEESKTLNVDGAVTLTVQDDAGDVTVVGGDVEKVEISIVKTSYASNQARAEAELKNIKYDIKQSGDKITITYKLPKISTINPDTVDFVVTVPTETTVTVDTNFGTVDVSGTKGAVDISNDFGDIAVENIEGALSVSNSSGTIEATAIKAGGKDIDLNSDFGDITLEKASAANITFDSSSGTLTLKDVNATGNLTVKSDFGDTTYENGSAESVNVEASSGSIKIIKVKVTKQIEVNNDFGDVELVQSPATSYDLHTNSGTVTVDGAKGKLTISDDFGDIEIINAQSATLDLETNSGNIEVSGKLGEGPHTVHSDFGNITFTLSADAKLNVDLKTDFGEINSDLLITVTLTEGSNSDGDEIVGAINGGGTDLTASTNSGNIKIQVSK